MMRVLFKNLIFVIACASVTYAQLPPDASLPQEALPNSDANIIQIKTEPLPKLKRQEDVARLPANALMDSFGLPMYVPIEKTAKKGEQSQADIAGGEIGRIVSRITIHGILPGQEAIIETYIVPVGGTFAVKVKENEVVLLHIKEITGAYITFGWSKDDASYRYVLPEKEEEDIYIEDATPKRKGDTP